MPQWEMATTTTMRRRRDQQRDGYASWVLTTFIAAALLIHPCSAQVEPCPSNPVLSGYASIAALNNDIQAEVDRIAGGGAPEEEYVFTLCPRHVFEVTTEALLPRLSGAVFQCGVSGSSTDNCVFRGGSEQIRVEDSTIATYPLVSVLFRGLKFEGFAGNQDEGGASVNVLASETTTIRFVDVAWTAFDSEFVVRQQRVPEVVPADITIDQAMVTNGDARVVFGADGGALEVRSVTVASVTAEVFILAENQAESTLSGSTIQSCELTSVTDTRSGAVQRVLDTTVSSMQDLEDAFIGTGTNTRVFLTRTSVVNNLLRERWRVLNVRDSAHGRALESTVARNTNLQFGFTASSSDSVMLIDDSFFEDNVGLGRNATSAPIITLQGAITSVERTEFNGNSAFTSHALAFFRSFLGIQQSCFRESDSTFVVFIDDDSSFSGTMNFVDTDVGSTYCAPPGNRLFAEDPGSSCFLGGTCEGQCEVLATEEKCLANLVDTGVPTGAPAAPSPPTQSPTVAPSTQEPSAAPTLPPISPAPTAFTRSPVVAPTSSPTIRGSSAPTPELEPEETVLPTVAPTECPNPKLIKQPKYKPKTKLSKYGRSGSRKKKQKDFKPVEKFYYGGGGSYAYKDSVAASTSKDQHEEEEDSLGYYYFWICPDSDSKSGKGKKSKDMGKGKMQSPQKSGMKKQMKSLKGSSKNTKSKGGGKGKGKRVLGENSTGEPRPGLRRHRL